MLGVKIKKNKHENEIPPTEIKLRMGAKIVKKEKKKSKS